MRRLKRGLITTLLLLITVSFMPGVKAYDSLIPFVQNGSSVKHFWSTENVMIPDTYDEKTTEFRGVWVATVYNLNMPVHTSETQYKSAFLDLVNELKESNMNAMLFQVRPLNDAFYDSDYAPYSRYLTGTEGGDPNWDVLAWMIETCHQNGIEFHAWMNPYRVANTTLTKEQYISSLDDNNFAKLHPELVVSGNVDSHGRNPLILNPGEPQVKEYIMDVVEEIITLYDVDGVHFDDYFYPYSGISSDIDTYITYKEPGESIEDFRRENVNDVVKGVKEVIDLYNTSSNEMVRFGISPFGLWGSNVDPNNSKYLPDGSNTGPTNMSSYHAQYADSKRWVEEGWLHYICPQVYWNFKHSTAPYADVVDWWASIARGTDVDVIIGHAPSTASSSNWLQTEIADQLRYNLKHPEIVGEVMYSASYLDHTHMEYVEDYYWTTTPAKAWEDTNTVVDISIDGELAGNIFINDVTVTLTALDTVEYKLDDQEWMTYTSPFIVNGEGAHILYVRTTDGVTSSPIVSENIVIQYINNDVPVISVSGTMINSSYVLDSILNITSTTNDIYIKINHGSIGEWVLFEGPIVLDDTGGYTVFAKTIDSNGAESDVVSKNITVVEETYDDPSITVSGVGTDPFYQEATVTLSSDTTVLYKINDGSYQTYTAPFTLDSEGTYTIMFKNDDALGTEFTREVMIDQTPPNNPELVIDGEYDGERYYTSETSLSFIVDEGVTVIYRLHNGVSWTEWTEYTTPIELIYSSTFYLDYKAVDQALNETEVLDGRVRVNIPPREDNVYVVRDSEIITYYDSNLPIELPTEYTEKTEEVRAVWVATVSNIDLTTFQNEEQYKAEIIKMLNTIESYNFNTIFFQVRPMNDAFYDSDYAPFSRYITGVEGQDPGFDILGFIIEESHKRGIELHAWLNPYRVSTGETSKESQLNLLHEDNFAKQNPDLVIADAKGRLILNPGERRVQVYIENVIRELITKYDVDGVHFDDYFYSYNGTPNEEDYDLYLAKREQGQSLDDWRRENINTVVREVFEIIEEHNEANNKTVLFGISPFGIWKSGEGGSNTSIYTSQSYYDQYADTKKWVEEGWVHYILPQLYWRFDHNSAPFADLVDFWAELCSENDVDLIIGQGLYRYVDDGWDDSDELLEQLRYMTKYDSIIGSSFFSYKTLLNQDKELVEALDRLKSYYWTEYVTFPWESDVVKQEVVVCEVGQTLIDNECVDDPVVCSDDQTLVDNECIDKVVTCDEGYKLSNNQCIKIEEDTGCFGTVNVKSILSMSILSIVGIITLLIGRNHVRRH